MEATVTQSETGDTSDTVSRDRFIGAMRNVANSVSVVTTGGLAGRHGATVSAFCSVSADPPTVLVCLKSDSRIARLVSGNRRFAVNVLASEQQSLAMRFAGGDDASLKLVQAGSDAYCDRFEGVELQPDSALPVLQGSMAFECRIAQEQVSGSHTVVIAEVTAVCGCDQQPLLYLDGGFRELAPNSGADSND